MHALRVRKTTFCSDKINETDRYTWSSNWAILINTSSHWRALSTSGWVGVVERLIPHLNTDGQADVRRVLSNTPKSTP